jgi:hypothetical protein
MPTGKASDDSETMVVSVLHRALARIVPEFSVERYRKDLHSLFKNKSQIDLTVNALCKADLK